jgi:ABC-2 type transport system permease protein
LSEARLVGHQLRYDLLVAWRNPQSRFFTMVLPIIFLVLLTSLFGNHAVRVHGHAIKNSTYYVPGIATLGVVSVAFVNLVITITVQRESGVLKRRRSTPVPAWVMIASRALTAVILASILVVVVVVIGRLVYGVHLPGSTIPACALAVAVGAASFCCLAFGVASFIRSDDAAQPVIQATVLPLYFISGVFVAASQLPKWLVDVASVFPVRHLASALLTAYNPHTRGAGFSAVDLLILAAWGAAGLVVAVRRFSWSPTGR